MAKVIVKVEVLLEIDERDEFISVPFCREAIKDRISERMEHFKDSDDKRCPHILDVREVATAKFTSGQHVRGRD